MMDEKLRNSVIQKIGTPLYIFDTDKATEQIDKFRNVVGKNAEICYAMKANPFIVERMGKEADYLEVCSFGELSICERAKVPCEKIVLSGVRKDYKDVLDAVEKYGEKITYTAESDRQFSFLVEAAKSCKKKIRVLLRLSAGNQFGMDKSCLEKIISESTSEFVQIIGIHYFSGTQKKSPSRYEKELMMLDGLIAELKEKYNFVVDKLEYGAGLPATYFEGEEDKQDEMLHSLNENLKKMCFKGKVVIELGRYIAASCGEYCTTISDQKKIGEEIYAIADGGINQLNYYGQMLAMKRPFLEKLGKDDISRNVTVCGSLCTANDVLLKNYPFNGLEIGDVLIFKNTGAYSCTEGISLFLSRDLPAVALYSKNDGVVEKRGHFKTDTLNF